MFHNFETTLYAALFCRHCDLLLFSIVSGDSSSWQLVFQHRLSFSAAIWDIAFLSEQHLLVLHAAEDTVEVACVSMAEDSSSVKVLTHSIIVGLLLKKLRAKIPV